MGVQVSHGQPLKQDNCVIFNNYVALNFSFEQTFWHILDSHFSNPGQKPDPKVQGLSTGIV